MGSLSNNPVSLRAARLGLMWVLVGMSPAVAAERPKITVVPFVAREGVTESAAAKFTQLTADELKARTDSVEVVVAPVSKAPAGGSGSAASASRSPSTEVLSTLDSAKKAFDDLRFEDAVRDFRRGLDGLLSDPATADFALVSDAHIKLAASYFRMGEEKEAKAALTDLARLSPSATLPAGFPPVFQREFEKAKKRVEKSVHGQISIEGPPGATAYLDGRDVGMVPVLEENLGAGMHYVRVDNTRGDRWGQAVEVKSGVTKARAMFGASSSDRAPIVATVPEARVGPTVDEAMVGRLQAYTKSAGADFALFGVIIRLSDSQLQAGTALYGVKRNAVSLLSPVAFDSELLTTANTEAYKLCDEAARRAVSFGTPTALPIDLTLHKASAGSGSVAAVKPPGGDDVVVAVPVKRPTLTPSRPVVKAGDGLTDKPVARIDDPEVKKGGVPVWVWVATGVLVAGGAAVGGYFAISNATRPVTGTVNATW